MKKYIDVKKLVEHKSPSVKTPYMRGWNDAIDAIIENEQTADVMPVVHARWIVNRDYGDCTCSACGTVYEDNGETISDYWNYCPHCGAKVINLP